MKNAILFDLDGTLWDTVAPITVIWNQVFEQNHVDKAISEEDLRGIMGKMLPEIGEVFFPVLSRERRMEILNLCTVAHCAYLKEHGAKLLFEKSALEKLREKYDLYIVSNCPCGYIEAFLESHKLQAFFKDIEMSGRTGKKKGENIQAVCKRNAISKCVYVGDTSGDETAASEAHVPFIFAAYGFGKAKNPAAEIRRFNELDAVLKEFFAI